MQAGLDFDRWWSTEAGARASLRTSYERHLVRAEAQLTKIRGVLAALAAHDAMPDKECP